MSSRLSNPTFANQIFATEKPSKLELLKVSQITQLGAEYIQTEVLAHVIIRYVEAKEIWYATLCTTCNREVENNNNLWMCDRCNCPKPYPEKKFKISVVGSDETGGIEIILGDQQVHTVIRKRVAQIIKEAGGDETFPMELKKMEKQKYIVKLMIKEVNVENNIRVYSATNICHGFVQHLSAAETTNIQESTAEESGSSYHLDGMSQLNFISPMTTKDTD